jgi:hypothetical protein
MKLNVGDTIKVGTREFIIEAGDSIIDNESCIQFKTGDMRALYWMKINGFGEKITSVILPNKLIKQIDFDYLNRREEPFGSTTKIIHFTFKHKQ